MYIVLTSGRDYYDESLTMHKSVLNNLERGAQLESYNDHDHNNDNNEPENQQLYHNHLEDSFYQKLRERSSSSGSCNRYTLKTY